MTALTKRDRKNIQQRWKRAEKWWWQLTGWIPLGHRLRGKQVADARSKDSMFICDVKSVKRQNAFIEKGLYGLEKYARHGQVKILVTKAEGARDGIVHMWASQFADLHCSIEQLEQEVFNNIRKND